MLLTTSLGFWGSKESLGGKPREPALPLGLGPEEAPPRSSECGPTCVSWACMKNAGGLGSQRSGSQTEQCPRPRLHFPSLGLCRDTLPPARVLSTSPQLPAREGAHQALPSSSKLYASFMTFSSLSFFTSRMGLIHVGHSGMCLVPSRALAKCQVFSEHGGPSPHSLSTPRPLASASFFELLWPISSKA